MTRVLEAFLGRPWEILPDLLEAGSEVLLAWEQGRRAVQAEDLKALETRAGRRLDGARVTTMHGDVAVIPVVGAIFRRANWITELCEEGISTEQLARDITTAIDNPQVRAVVLEFDSPGGELAGIGELAATIYAARERKPVVAHVESLGASAALHLAVACQYVVVDPQAMMGSIGVVSTVRTRKTPYTIEIVSSQSPNKRPDVETEQGRAQIQEVVDDLAAVFVADVARYRGTTPERVMKEFGAGGLLVGQRAVDVGLADRLGTLESVIAEVQGGRAPRRAPARASSEASTTAPRGAREVSMSEKKEGEGAGILAAIMAIAGLNPVERAQVIALASGGTLPMATAQAPAQSAPQTEKTARERELEAKYNAEREERLKLEAGARTEAADKFAMLLMKDSRIVPAQAKALKPLHARLAELDARASEGEPKLVPQLEAILKEAPQHSLTTEQLAPEGAQALEPVATTPDAKTKAKADAEKWVAETNPGPAPGQQKGGK